MEKVKLTPEQDKAVATLFNVIQSIPPDIRRDFYEALVRTKREIPNDYELGNTIRNLL